MLFVICVSASSGAFDFTISSGYHGTQMLEGQESLLMTGGGVLQIVGFDSSYVEIRGTAPLQDYVGGIPVIGLNHNSTMDYYGGETGGLYMYGNATANLQGGRINYISSYQDVFNVIVGRDEQGNPIFNKHIEMIVREWAYNSQTKVLSGVWNVDNNNDSLFDTFAIQLHNQTGYDPVIDNITFTIIPEPSTLCIIAAGAWLLGRRFDRG
jgi:hypothetical protein